MNGSTLESDLTAFLESVGYEKAGLTSYIPKITLYGLRVAALSLALALLVVVF
jgi:hypothetical protein